LLLFLLLCLFVYFLSGIYLNPEKHRQFRVFGKTLVATGIISVIVFFALVVADVRLITHYHEAFLALWGMLLGTTYFFRFIICYIRRKNYKTGKWTIRTAIIGTGENAQKIAQEIAKNMPENTLIGFIADDKNAKKTNILGEFSQIDKLIESENIHEIIIALDDTDENRLFSIINALYSHNIVIRFMPRLYEILIGGVKIQNLEISPLVTVTSLSMSDWEACVKRFFDIAVSFFALLLLLPFFAIMAIRIKMDSKGSVFFSQERIGQFGKPFNILKFRTMYENAENGTPQLSTASDSRVTRFGKFLRKHRLDELPQFWNVLIGEMSIVGPRPERQFYINKISEIAPYYCLLYKIRPGLTSWGPIRIGYSDTIEKMVERLNYDIIYLDNMSLITDFKILLYTIEVIFKGKEFRI